MGAGQLPQVDRVGSRGDRHPAGVPDQHFAHPVVFGLEDFQAVTPDLQAHRAIGNRLQRLGHQAVEGLGAVAGQVPVQALVQFADRRRAIDNVAAILEPVIDDGGISRLGDAAPGPEGSLSRIEP